MGAYCVFILTDAMMKDDATLQRRFIYWQKFSVIRQRVRDAETK